MSSHDLVVMCLHKARRDRQPEPVRQVRASVGKNDGQHEERVCVDHFSINLIGYTTVRLLSSFSAVMTSLAGVNPTASEYVAYLETEQPRFGARVGVRC
jgi:hypothetical protein